MLHRALIDFFLFFFNQR